MTAEPAEWDVQLSGPAQRDLNRLPPKVTAAVVEFITGVLPGNPHRLSKELTNDLAGVRSARRGDYRVLFELHDDTHVLLVIRIDHRAHVYRPR